MLSRGSRALASRRFPIFPATGHQSGCSGWRRKAHHSSHLLGLAPVAAPEQLHRREYEQRAGRFAGSSGSGQEEWEPQPLSETIGSVDDDYGLADQRFTLEAACRKLPVRERLVLHMRFIEDRTQSEIAATIGLSQMQASRILRGAIDRLELAAGPELEY